MISYFLCYGSALFLHKIVKLLKSKISVGLIDEFCDKL